MPRARSWTDEQLIVAVAASKTLGEVFRRLGVTPGGYYKLQKHIERLEIDHSHLAPRLGSGRRRFRSWTDEQLAQIVREESTLADVLRRLGYRPSGGMHRQMVAWIREAGIDASHFTGRSWARGKMFPGRGAIPLDQILVANSTYADVGKLRRRLIAAGLKPAHCERCGLAAWCGELMPLTLDHINGDHCDNRLENLRILCPNCHALTETWCGRGRPA